MISAGWTLHEFKVGDFLTPTARIKVRFEASDLGGGSIVEAGVDRFLVTGLVCQNPDCPGDLDRDVCLADLARLLARYGDTGASHADGALDEDDDVDLADSAALLVV